MATKPLSNWAIKRRIRKLLAAEMRSRLDECPSYIENEPQEVIDAWRETVWDIADTVYPENAP